MEIMTTPGVVVVDDGEELLAAAAGYGSVLCCVERWEAFLCS